MPLAYNRRPSKGRPEVVLRATQGNHNNIPYIAPPLLTVSPQSLLFCGREIIRAYPKRGSKKY